MQASQMRVLFCPEPSSVSPTHFAVCKGVRHLVLACYSRTQMLRVTTVVIEGCSSQVPFPSTTPFSESHSVCQTCVVCMPDLVLLALQLHHCLWVLLYRVDGCPYPQRCLVSPEGKEV